MSDDEFEVEEILTSRTRNKQTEYLVRWKGYGSDSDSWEPAANLLNCSEVLDRFNEARSLKRNRSSKKPAPERNRSRSSSRSNNNAKNVPVKPVEVVINGGMPQEKHSAVAELVKSSLDISPRSFKEIAGRYPTIKEIKSHATHRSYQKFTVNDQVSDDEIDDAPSHFAPSEHTRFHLGKYLFVFSGVVCGFAIVWAGLLWILSLPVMNGNQNDFLKKN